MSFARTTTAAEGLPRRRFTIADVESMIEAGVVDRDERIELVGGELVPMSPKGRHHEILKTGLLQHWYRIAPVDTLLTPETTLWISDDTYVEPDIVIYSRATGLIGLTPANALLIVEIADSSLPYDMARKPQLYASHGVQELWVINALDLSTRIFREPAAAGYAEILDFAPFDKLSPILAPAAFALRLKDLDLG
jgi:Uma2 family endonuclease